MKQYSTNHQNVTYIEMEMHHIEANTGMPNRLHLQLQMQNSKMQKAFWLGRPAECQ